MPSWLDEINERWAHDQAEGLGLEHIHDFEMLLEFVDLYVAVANAAAEVWLDSQAPSRWFEDSTFESKGRHEEELGEALKRAGYKMTFGATT